MSDHEPPTGAPPPDSASPAQGKPKREGNISLWKRARQTLGTNSLTFLQPQSKPTQGSGADNTSTSAGPTAPSKRREQVRHAQRTHRQRTQNYIKTLESEVVRLRGSEVNLMIERDKLQSQVDILKTTLTLSNVPLPAGLEDSATAAHQTPESTNQLFSSTDLPTAADMPATVSYRTDDLSHNRLHVNWPVSQEQDIGFNETHQQSFHDSSAVKPLPTVPTDLPEDLSLQTLNFNSAPLDFNSDFTNTPQPTQRLVKHLDTAEIAIDFVLALEHPCMAHLGHPSQNPSSDPTGHVLMASTPLISYSNSPPNKNDTWPWTANGSVIKELLHLSASINLEGEITPVEAWHRFRSHPGFGRLDRWGIERFKGDLSKVVDCQGFGAVIDEEVFEQTLYNLLGPRQ